MGRQIPKLVALQQGIFRDGRPLGIISTMVKDRIPDNAVMEGANLDGRVAFAGRDDGCARFDCSIGLGGLGL